MDPTTTALLRAIRERSQFASDPDGEDYYHANQALTSAEEAWMLAGCPDAGGTTAQTSGIGASLNDVSDEYLDSLSIGSRWDDPDDRGDDEQAIVKGEHGWMYMGAAHASNQLRWWVGDYDYRLTRIGG